MTWVDPEEAREEWPDAPLDDDVLDRYLDAAYEACVAYAPPLGSEDEVPQGYRVAQVMQARAIYRSLTAGGRDEFGAEGIAVTVFPLDFNVRQLLRPRQVHGLDIR